MAARKPFAHKQPPSKGQPLPPGPPPAAPPPSDVAYERDGARGRSKAAPEADLSEAQLFWVRDPDAEFVVKRRESCTAEELDHYRTYSIHNETIKNST